MLTKKQQIFFNFIIDCYQKTKEMPTIGVLKKSSNYKSYNTIYKYLKQLEEKEYIKLDNKRKKIIYIKKYLKNNLISNIPIINENEFISLNNSLLNIKYDYIAFKLHNNRLNSYCLKNKDILIIEKNLTKLNNKFVLVFINNNYYILKYINKDGFIHLINDKESFVLERFDSIIGKVILTIRTTMD